MCCVPPTADLLNSQECELVTRKEPLPLGCELSGSRVVSMSSCSQQECGCDRELLGQTSICCCKATHSTEVSGIQCSQGTALTGFRNATSCGCGSCDDIEVTITLTVEAMRTNEPIPAAQIFRVNGPASNNDLTFIGITDNSGRFRHRESVVERSVVFRVQAPGYLAQLTPPFNLQPSQMQLSHGLVLMPSMHIQAGMGDSPFNLRLGNMISLSAPAGAFRDANGDVYRDMVVFTGGVVNVGDDEELATVPFASFYYSDPESGDQSPFSMLTAIVIIFEDPSGVAELVPLYNQFYVYLNMQAIL